MISSGSIITYGDLVSNVLNAIYSKCQNIDSFASSVPDYLKNGYSKTVTGPTVAGAVTNATMTVNDSVLSVVSRATVQSDFNSFLASRGISNKSETVMSLRGILNFMANAAAFIKARVVNVAVSDEANSAVCVFRNCFERLGINFIGVFCILF